MSSHTNDALHLVAWTALRLGSPRRAKRIVDALGRWLPPLRDMEEARTVLRGLRRHGTCLSRSLTVAARLPGADVVIGVDPAGKGPISMSAHAWVEVRGTPVEADEPRGAEIARL